MQMFPGGAVSDSGRAHDSPSAAVRAGLQQQGGKYCDKVALASPILPGLGAHFPQHLPRGPLPWTVCPAVQACTDLGLGSTGPLPGLCPLPLSMGCKGVFDLHTGSVPNGLENIPTVAFPHHLPPSSTHARACTLRLIHTQRGKLTHSVACTFMYTKKRHTLTHLERHTHTLRGAHSPSGTHTLREVHTHSHTLKRYTHTQRGTHAQAHIHTLREAHTQAYTQHTQALTHAHARMRAAAAAHTPPPTSSDSPFSTS